jgi:excisionase family DNA binding protein
VSGSTPYPAGMRFLTVFEADSIMRVSKRTVYRLIHAGELGAIKVCGSYRIPDQAVTLSVLPFPDMGKGRTGAGHHARCPDLSSRP